MKRAACSICHVEMPIETLGVHHALIHPKPFDTECPATVSNEPTPENGDDECD